MIDEFELNLMCKLRVGNFFDMFSSDRILNDFFRVI